MRRPVDKHAASDVLKHLIRMAQGMMMKGHGDNEEAGNKISDAMKDGSLAEEGSPEEEHMESPEEEAKEDATGGPDDDFEEYKRLHMKNKQNHSLPTRKSAVMMLATKSPIKSFGGRR